MATWDIVGSGPCVAKAGVNANSDIDPSKDWDAYSLRFNPEAVMNKFSKVFLR